MEGKRAKLLCRKVWLASDSVGYRKHLNGRRYPLIEKFCPVTDYYEA